MTQLRTQLYASQSPLAPGWTDTQSSQNKWVFVEELNPQITPDVIRREYNHSTGAEVSSVQRTLSNFVATFNSGDSVNIQTGIYTFADGQPNRFQTATITYNAITQPMIAGLASSSVVLDADGNPEVLSKLTSVISSDETVSITITDGQVDLSANTTIPSDLSVTTLETSGLATLNSLDVTANASVGGNATITGSVSAASADFAGAVVAASADFTGGAVKADYALLKAYPENQIPVSLPAGALFRISAAV